MENMNLIETATVNRKNEKGVTTVEYAVMLVLVAIAVATATPNIATAVKGVFTQVINIL
jgi:Flp pilus assembly pilin Flp